MTRHKKSSKIQQIIKKKQSVRQIQIEQKKKQNVTNLKQKRQLKKLWEKKVNIFTECI